MSVPIFREQVQEQEAALARLEREKLALEKDRTRLSGLLGTAKGDADRLQAVVDQRDAEIHDLERKLNLARQGQDEMAELRRLKEQAEQREKETAAALTLANDSLLLAGSGLERLQTENGELAQAKTDLEAEVAPMRPIIRALKDRLDADRRIALEAKKL